MTSSVAFENFFAESWSPIEFVTTNLRLDSPFRKCRPHPSVMDRTLNECQILEIDPNNGHSVNGHLFSDNLKGVVKASLNLVLRPYLIPCSSLFF